MHKKKIPFLFLPFSFHLNFLPFKGILPTALLVLSSGFLISCGEAKTTVSVFPEQKMSASNPCEEESLKNQFIVQWEDGKITLQTAPNTDSFIESFLQPQLNKIKHVEYDKKIRIKPLAKNLGLLKKLSTTELEEQKIWGQKMIEADKLWEQNIMGEGVAVAVVDLAVDYHHPQIFSQLAPNEMELNGKPDFDDDANGFIDDYYGWDFFSNRNDPFPNESDYIVGEEEHIEHGTHVAGIIAANHDMGDMKGLAPKAKIIPVNFMDRSGGGSLGLAIMGINYAASRGAKIINASWGGGNCSLTLKNTISDLTKQNILFISASGNESLDLDSTPEYPATFNLPNQITVAASRASDLLASFSNTSYNYVHLAAPGDNIYSTTPNNSYAFLSGTSMATPFVSAAAALVWGFCPKAQYYEILESLLRSVDTKEYRVLTRGRLNVRKAIEEIQKIVPHCL